MLFYFVLSNWSGMLMAFSFAVKCGCTFESSVSFYFFIFIEPLCCMSFFLALINVSFHGFLEFTDDGKHIPCVNSSTIVESEDDFVSSSILFSPSAKSLRGLHPKTYDKFKLRLRHNQRNAASLGRKFFHTGNQTENTFSKPMKPF